MSEPKIKFALIGCGYIGSRYINILSHHPQCELGALVDSDCKILSNYKNLTIPFFHSIENYFNSGLQSDAVVVATPNSTHASIAIASLEQNKHVLVEKPMALRRSDAELVIQTAKQRNKKAMVVLQNRFSPASIWLKEMVKSKQLGKIFFTEINCFWNRDERYYQKGSWHGKRETDGGSLFTQFSHFIDTIFWLFGEVKNIRSRFNNFNHQDTVEFEDTGSIQFELEQGGIGCLNFTTAIWDKSFESSLLIIGQNGTVKVSGQQMNRIDYCHVKNYHLPEKMLKLTDTGDNHANMIDYFIESIRRDGLTNTDEALQSVDIIERMYAGADQER